MSQISRVGAGRQVSWTRLGSTGEENAEKYSEKCVPPQIYAYLRISTRFQNFDQISLSIKCQDFD